MTTALLLLIAAAFVLTVATVFMVSQLKNAPEGFEDARGFHLGTPDHPGSAEVVAIEVGHRDAA